MCIYVKPYMHVQVFFLSNEEYNQINSEYYTIINVDVCVNDTHAIPCTMDRCFVESLIYFFSGRSVSGVDVACCNIMRLLSMHI